MSLLRICGNSGSLRSACSSGLRRSISQSSCLVVGGYKGGREILNNTPRAQLPTININSTPSKKTSQLLQQRRTQTRNSTSSSSNPPQDTNALGAKMPQPYKTTDKTSDDLLSLLANRRTYYSLSATSPVPVSKIQHILQQALLTVPSAFNSQTTRMILALGPHHQKVWDITASLLRSHMGEERWSSAPTAKKIAGFRNAYGTVLFYEDTVVVEEKKAAFANYAEHFEPWSEQTSGMHQLAVWVALEAEGFGANLQHYNPIVDAEVAGVFGVPEGWRLRSQLVFGGVEQDRPAAKEKRDFKETLRVFGGEE